MLTYWLLLLLFMVCLQGFDVVLSDMLQFTSGVNDVELSLELASTAMNVATGHYYDEYGEAYAQQVGFRHTGFLRPGGNLVMKVYEVRVGWFPVNGLNMARGASCSVL
jgi:23S rRNA U2552 (ribose-2'-O)-methylase RlmE/FtsJ